MEKNKSIKKGLIIGLTVCTLNIVGFLSSYAYFISNIGNNKNQEVTIETGTFELTFSDGNQGITESLEFGSSIEKTFTVENTGSLEAIAKISFEDLVNTYLESSLTYTLSYSDEENGVYQELITNKNVPKSENSSTEVLADGLVIPSETKYYYKLTITLNYLEETDQTADLNAIFSTHFKLEEGTKIFTSKETLSKLNLTAKEGQPNFAEAATSDETADGLYAMADDYGTSYYYRGATEDNYVKFAEFYWRIIRINGDGSLRIIYDGTQAHANETNDMNRIAFESAFNEKLNDTKYIGYMYGPNGTNPSTSKEEAQTNTESSTIKIKLEEWYKINIKNKGLDEFVADSIFCNDRSTPGKDATGLNSDTGLGYGKNATAYGASVRVGPWKTSELKPSFICPNKNDAFTVNDIEKGNGTLNEKIGLITADEIVTAGSGKYNTLNSKYYLHKGPIYWSLSPCHYDNASIIYNVIIDGYLNYNYTDRSHGVAPVISLTPEHVNTLIGDGTINNPYRSPNEIP